MEQKQLDEIEPSFTGEEFIEEDIIIEQARPKAKPMAKNVIAKPTKKEVKDDKETKRIPEKKAEVRRMVEVKAAKAAKKIEKNAKEESKMEPITPVQKTEPKIEVWHEEPKAEESKGLFKEVSTWKALTGIVLILLLLSVFTQGFSFAKGNEITGAAISQVDAETQALAFVNDNLLQPPFTAQVQSTEEMGSLYKIIFSIAGEEVNSYMTKDGTLFFPQGFDPKRSLLDQLTTAGTSASSPDSAVPEGEFIEEVIINGSSGEIITRQVPVEEETAPVEETTTGSTDYTIKAKKWFFSPNKIKVPLGSTVTLRITPEDMNTFTFLLTAFRVRQEVSGPTTVQFTADKKGTFPFSCGSCGEFRGMTGTVVVE